MGNLRLDGLEQELIDALTAGTMLSLQDREDQTVPANLIRRALLGQLTTSADMPVVIDPRGLRLEHVVVDGILDLANVTTSIAMAITHSRIPNGVTLNYGKFSRGIDLSHTIIGSDKDSEDESEAVVAGDSVDQSGPGILRAEGLWTTTLTLTRTTIHDHFDLRGAHITGRLDLSGANITGADTDGDSLIADRVTLDGDMFCASDGGHRFTTAGAVRLSGAHITGQLGLTGANLGANTGGDSLAADRLAVDGGMYCASGGGHRFTTAGAVRLHGAHITGQLSLTGANLGANTGGNSLAADNATVDGGMFCQPVGDDRFTTAGTVRLHGAHITGQLGLTGANITGADTSGNSLIADRVAVDGDMYCAPGGGHRFTTTGAVCLPGAHITGKLGLPGANLGANTRGNSLIADNATVDGGMFCQPVGDDRFTTAGAVRLHSAHITGQLGLAGANITGADTSGNSLIADDATVDGGMFCQPVGDDRFTTAGAVRLHSAHITGQLGLAGANITGADTSGDSLICESSI